MNRFFAMLLLLPFACIAQVRFEKGYFIDNHGKKTECLIRNKGWKNNPTTFNYRLSETSEIQERTMEVTAEFGIENTLQYVRVTVPMERSSTKINNLQKDAQYKLVEETHFFKRIFEGSHSLYVFEESGLLKFFDRKPSGEFNQLIYIEYLDINRNLRRYNQYYTQLLNDFSCPGATLESFSKLKYTEPSLLEYYHNTADCKGEKTVQVERKTGEFHIRPFVGFKSMNVSADALSTLVPNAEVSEFGAAYGLELEYLLPTFQKKWAVLLSVEYNNIEGDYDLPDGSNGQDRYVTLSYSAIQIPVGMRYYMHLNNDFKLFVNPLFVANFVKDETTASYHPAGTASNNLVAEKNSYNFAVGAGLAYKKFNAEIRYYTSQGLFQYADGDFNKISFTVSYAIF